MTTSAEAGAVLRPSEEYERQARAEEASPAPFVLKATRVLAWFVYVIVIVRVSLLLTAFFLRLAGANPEAGFAAWVYGAADRSMDPFRGIFPTEELSGDSVLDLSLLFAAVVYMVIALLVDVLLRWVARHLSERERRIARLRAASHDAALREYAADQQFAAHQAWVRQQAAIEAATPAPPPTTPAPPSATPAPPPATPAPPPATPASPPATPAPQAAPPAPPPSPPSASQE